MFQAPLATETLARASLGTCSEQAMSVLGISQDFLGLQAEFKSMKAQPSWISVPQL